MDAIEGTGLSVTTTSGRQKARADEHHERVRDTARSHRLWGGERRRMVERTMVRGEWIFYWRPDIDQLKREGRLGEALDLAWECMEAAERLDPDDYPPPGWYQIVAIICRKMGLYEREVVVLERALTKADPKWDVSDIEHRLDRAKGLSAGAPSSLA